MQSQTLVKNFVEVMHEPARLDAVLELMRKSGGTADASIQQNPAAEGWTTTIAVFFDRRKSTTFCKNVTQHEGVGSVRRSSEDVTYAPMSVEKVSSGRNGALSVLVVGKKRPLRFVIEHSKHTQRFGKVGKTNPRRFWYDEALVEPEEADSSHLADQ